MKIKITWGKKIRQKKVGVRKPFRVKRGRGAFRCPESKFEICLAQLATEIFSEPDNSFGCIIRILYIQIM